MKSEEERLTDGNELRRPSAEQITQLQGVAQRFHTLTVSAPVGIFLDDAQGNAIYINEKCAELIGVPMDQAIGLDWIGSLSFILTIEKGLRNGGLRR